MNVDGSSLGIPSKSGSKKFTSLILMISKPVFLSFLKEEPNNSSSSSFWQMHYSKYGRFT